MPGGLRPPPVVQCDNEHFCSMRGAVLDNYIDTLLKDEGKSYADYAAKPGEDGHPGGL